MINSIEHHVVFRLQACRGCPEPGRSRAGVDSIDSGLILAWLYHYGPMNVMAFQITVNSTDCSTACSGYKANTEPSHYRPLVRGIHRWPVDSPHKGPVIWKAFPCHDVIILYAIYAVPYNQTLSLQHENLSKHDRDLYHVELLINTCTCTGTCPYWQLQLIANKMACV